MCIRDRVGPADADDHQSGGLGLDLSGGSFDTREFLAVIILGQMHPADKIIARAGGVLEPCLSLGQGV